MTSNEIGAISVSPYSESKSLFVAVHEEVLLTEMEFDSDMDGYVYDCPCGDEFFISLEDLKQSINIAECPSCSLRIRVIYDQKQFAKN